MKPAERNVQDRSVGGHQETSAVLTTEVPQAPSCSPTKEEVLCLIAKNYIHTTPPKCKEDHDNFLLYMERMKCIIADVHTGSLVITVKCSSLEFLEKLWKDYRSGNLGEVVQRCFATEEVLVKLNLAELTLKTTILEEDYEAYKMYFEKESAARVGPKQEPPHFIGVRISTVTDNKDREWKKLPVYKVVLCGKSNVGKTSIFRRLRGDGFKEDTSKFDNLAEDKIKVRVRNKTIKIDLWDTSGMERYSRLTRQHYIGSHVVLLVYDCDDIETLKELKDYYKDATDNSNGAAMVLIRNKIDKEFQSVDISEAEKLLCNHQDKGVAICKFKFRAETSAKDNTGIKELIQRVAEYLIKNAKPSNSRSEFDRMYIRPTPEPVPPPAGCC